MTRKTVLLAAFGVMLVSCAGVYGPKGNDAGGIIPWSPENEAMAHEIAQSNCGRFNKVAVFRSVRRVYGDYIAYDCRFPPAPKSGRR